MTGITVEKSPRWGGEGGEREETGGGEGGEAPKMIVTMK
jgi:hypothetical protein